MSKKKSGLWLLLGGLVIGAVNGIFGAGGGALAVPMLQKSGLSPKEAHAGAIGVILPITLLSVALYVMAGSASLEDAYPFLPGTLLGSVAGALFLKKITSRWLKGAFGAMLIFAGIRMALV